MMGIDGRLIAPAVNQQYSLGIICRKEIVIPEVSLLRAEGKTQLLLSSAGGRRLIPLSRRNEGPADAPLKIAVRPEKCHAKPGEIVYVPVNIEGANGVVESNADRKLTVTVEGGELLAFGSANPCTEEQYHTGSFTTYYGRTLAVVRAGEAGTVSIKASDGSMTGTAEIAVK